ncbi:hypothetical protein M2277_005673 [Paenibacillus sp. LBL]|uniref:hypothetical protein n=1 Tax=Paenibacillus sp. LBL TaxID=2940563 RepID=UPI002473F9FA|nr:hypothetical protein [Paenibacillus sp. LBL]MDH6674974.1 hypothetical protein [Paenibacillus sp. LBL]
MKFMEFKHKDIYVKVHTPLIVTREIYDGDKKQREELVYANVIDIDSRVQAVFAQFHHARKASDVSFGLRHAPRVGEKNYDKSSFYVKPVGKYKHLSQREDETFVTGIVVGEKVLERQKDGFIIFAWDGNIQEKFFWAIDRYYETPLLEEWTPYLFNQLINDNRMIPLTIHDFTGDYSELVVYDLLVGEEILDEYISYGLKTGLIVMTEDDHVKEAI